MVMGFESSILIPTLVSQSELSMYMVFKSSILHPYIGESNRVQHGYGF